MQSRIVVFHGAMTFKEQVDVMASTSVLIALHGAGLTNLMFMQPGTVVIEIFPPHVKHVLYERMAHYAGVYHFKVRAR